MIVGRGSGDRHALGTDAVDRPELLPLRVVPDDDPIGHRVNQALRCQMIPAADAQYAADAEAARATHVLPLPRSEIQQRRDEHQIRPLGAKEAQHFGRNRQRAFDASHDSAKGIETRPAAE